MHVVAFRLNPDLLGHTTFAFSPMAEAASALVLLGNPRIGGIHEPWIRAARQATAGVDLELLTALVPDRPLLPSVFYQPAESPQTTFETQLRSLERSGMATIAADVTAIWSDRVPARLAEVIARGDAGIREITGALWDFWQCAMAPHWSRICAVLEDDVAYRAGRIVTGGLYDLLSDLHPETSVEHRLLRIDKPHHCDSVLSCGRLLLVPSVFTHPRLVVDHEDEERFVLVYGARGAARTWEGIGQESSEVDHLAGLLGRNRAAILARLNVPMTTSQLAHEIDYSLATVSEHLRRLRAAGLLTSWRTGRRVYYRQTPLAATLIEAGALDQRENVG